MRKYLDAQRHISKKKKKGWQIAKLGKNIEAAFRLGDKIAEISIRDKETSNVIAVLYYTPVTKKLRKMAEKLGNYLHAQKKYIAPDDEGWNRMRTYLESVYAELEKANKGTLLGPPLLNKRTGQVEVKVEFSSDEEKMLLTNALKPGLQNILGVGYLDDIPDKLH